MGMAMGMGMAIAIAIAIAVAVAGCWIRGEGRGVDLQVLRGLQRLVVVTKGGGLPCLSYHRGASSLAGLGTGCLAARGLRTGVLQRQVDH